MFQTPLGFSNLSAFSARSAVKLGGMVISLEKSIVPATAPFFFSSLSPHFLIGLTTIINFPTSALICTIHNEIIGCVRR